MNFLYKINMLLLYKEIFGFFSIQPKEISFHKNEFSF